jgi:hypothetical protein
MDAVATMLHVDFPRVLTRKACIQNGGAISASEGELLCDCFASHMIASALEPLS